MCVATATVPLSEVSYGSGLVEAPLQMRAATGKAAPTGLVRPGDARTQLRQQRKQRKESGKPGKNLARVRMYTDLRV